MDLSTDLHLVAGLGAFGLGIGVFLRDPGRTRNRLFALLCGCLCLWNLTGDDVREGLTVLFAQVGAVLPGDFKLKNTKIRGIESMGMICSASELSPIPLLSGNFSTCPICISIIKINNNAQCKQFFMEGNYKIK